MSPAAFNYVPQIAPLPDRSIVLTIAACAVGVIGIGGFLFGVAAKAVDHSFAMERQ